MLCFGEGRVRPIGHLSPRKMLEVDVALRYNEHSAGNPRTVVLPFVVGTPGDFLAWLRDRLRGE